MKIYIDLSNLMSVDFLTGIQRVVKEIVIRMLENDNNELVLMDYSFRRDSYRRLDNKKFYEYFAHGTGDRKFLSLSESIRFEDIQSGSVFFEIDSVWNSRLRRSYLFPILKQKGVGIVTLVYDIIPITHPQFCHENTVMNFMVYIGANIKYADLIITSAQATIDALNTLTDKLGVERKNCVAIPLGSDFSEKNVSGKSNKPDPEVVEIARKGKYILMVGTVEPRKNHSLVIDALENGLAEMGVNAIFAGRIGWNVEELEDRMKNHSLYGKNLFFIEKPDDVTVDYLYKNALAVAFPTFNEGFGLPVIEAFMRGTPVIASDIKVLHEVAGDFADYFNPNDSDGFAQCVKNLLDENIYKSKKESIKNFKPYTWDESARDMQKAVESVIKKPEFIPDGKSLRQLVCLTARNDDILATLPYIENFMPFIREIVLCCPDKNVDELKEKYRGRLVLKFLTDSEVLAGEPLPDDHSTRNFFLRCHALKNPLIDDVFIMTDDDYRPLKEISPENFIENGCYRAYYCYDLNLWQGTYGSPTSFDVSMKKTLEFLSENGCPTMMYSSHQMQVIDKRIFNDMTEKHPEIVSKGLCDWSAYFNWGVKNHPEIFRPEPYVSMGWPGARSDWDLYVVPEEFLFENHYSVLYEKGRVFEGLSDTFNEKTTEENQVKITRYMAELLKQREGNEVYRSYCNAYWVQHRELPSFTALCTDDSNITISTPTYVQFRNSCWTRVDILIDKSVTEEISRKLILEYWFSDETGENMTPVGRIRIDTDNLEFKLPVKSPVFCERCVFNMKLLAEDKNVSASASMTANII